jgi:hypothetical protein
MARSRAPGNANPDPQEDTPVPRPILTIDALRIRRTPLYDGGRIVGFRADTPAEVRGTLYFQNGSTMKLFQTLNEEEQRELEDLLTRATTRILSLMTVALSQDETTSSDT